MGRRYWTDEDLKYLANNYGKIPIEEISKKLNRTIQAMMQKTYQLGLGQSVYKGVIYIKNCGYCNKKFETELSRGRYCSKKCAELKAKDRYYETQNKMKKDLEEQRKAESIKNKELRKKLNDVRRNNEYENIKIFFRINCLGLDKARGIKKIEEFTGRKDAEIIYENLRKEFLRSRFI